ncbi:MAG TPA: 50S ribosomal protein L11 methyltransferase, partial [Thermoleophilaceae bacterium]|nr:50S ribosomal protein L11 methyltransferase [Thermoleophilaceae bacterium]
MEDVLDRLLLLVPSGVREVPRGRHVELRVRGSSLPPADEIKRAAGGWPHLLTVREVPDDWRRRRLADYAAEPIGRRLVVRPEWAPRAPKGAIDIALSESAAFGAGTHPTTQLVLRLLLAEPPGGALCDWGAGTGVLAVAAARLGWAPV